MCTKTLPRNWNETKPCRIINTINNVLNVQQEDTNYQISTDIDNINIKQKQTFTEDRIRQEIEIKQHKLKWWINVPVQLNNGNIIKIEMLADPGANVGCVNTEWALKNFKEYIVNNNKNSIIATPNGTIWPKFAIWLSFPHKDKPYYYKAKFLLLDNTYFSRY